MNRTTLHVIWIALLLVSGAWLRLRVLDQDPPASMELHFVCDEGWWVHNARNMALFDRWIVDDFNQSLLASPTFCLSVYKLYKLFGVSLASSRLASALSGLLCIPLFYLILVKLICRSSAALATSFLAIGFGFVTLNRLALIDSMAFLLALLSWLLIERLGDRVWGMYVAGMMAGIAVITKSYVWALAPVLVSIAAARMIRTRKPLRTVLLETCLFGFGIMTIYAFWHKALYVGFREQYRIMYALWNDGNIPDSVGQMLRNIPSTFLRTDVNGIFLPHFLALNSILILLAAWRLVQLLPDRRMHFRSWCAQIPPIDIDSLIWLVLVGLEITFLTAKPFRRYIFLYPPLMILAARSSLQPAFQGRASHAGFRILRSILLAVPLTLLLGVPLIAQLISRGPQNALEGQLNGPRAMGPAMLLATGMFLMCAFGLGWFLRRPIRGIPIWLALAIFIGADGYRHADYLFHPSFDLRDTSRRLEELYLKPGDYFLGGLAHTLSLENDAHPIAIWGREETGLVLNRDPIRRFHPSYMIVLRSLDGNPWFPENRYERYVTESEFVETLNLLPLRHGGFRVVADLYRLHNEEKSP